MNYLVFNQLIYDDLQYEIMQSRRESNLIEVDEETIISEYQNLDKTSKILEIILTDKECNSIVSITSEFTIRKDKENVFLCNIKTEKAHSAGIIVNTYSSIVGKPSEIMAKITDFIRDYGVAN